MTPEDAAHEIRALASRLASDAFSVYSRAKELERQLTPPIELEVARPDDAPTPRMKTGAREAKSELQRIRAALGISQSEMAKQLGVSTGTIFNWEHMKTSMPDEKRKAAQRLLASQRP